MPENQVHRDIKPSNIKFDGEGILKILDFGLVSQLPTDDETIDARGTRNYLAPELYDPPPIKVTPAIDVYAFGVTAWYLLGAGVLPKSLRQIPPQVFLRHLHRSPQLRSHLRIRLSPRLIELYASTPHVGLQSQVCAKRLKAICFSGVTS